MFLYNTNVPEVTKHAPYELIFELRTYLRVTFVKM